MKKTPTKQQQRKSSEPNTAGASQDVITARRRFQQVDSTTYPKISTNHMDFRKLPTDYGFETITAPTILPTPVLNIEKDEHKPLQNIFLQKSTKKFVHFLEFF